jgi:putative transcriptional regulator
LRRLAEAAVGNDWRFVVPGVRAVDLPAAGPGVTVRLVAFKPGVTIPIHDHGGPERVVVFSGALEEEGKRFERGDISIRDAGERHEQHVVPGQPCIALVVNEGALKPLTLRGRLLLALSRR